LLASYSVTSTYKKGDSSEHTTTHCTLVMDHFSECESLSVRVTACTFCLCLLPKWQKQKFV